MPYFGPYGQYSLVIELVILTLISVRQCQRRNRFFIRAAFVSAVFLGIVYFISRPILITDYSGLNRPYIYELLIGACIYCCFDLTLWQATYLMAVAYALQYCMYSLWLGLCVLFIPDCAFLMESTVVYVNYGIAMLTAMGIGWYVSRKNKYLSQLEKFNAPVFVVFILVIFAAAYLTGESIKTELFQCVLLVRYACTIVCMIGIVYASTVLVYQQVSLNRALYQQIIQRQKEEYEQRRASVDDLNIKCHDLKYQIRSIFQKKGEANMEDLKDIEASIRNIQNAYRTGCTPLDIIISEKARLCSQKDIAFSYMGDGKLISFMKEVDIYRLFNNAIDNAIEAVEQVEHDKKIIGVTIQKAGPFITIHFENYCIGMLQLQGGLPQTSKQDKQNHGFGVRSMKSIAESYQGELKFGVEGEVFSLDILFPVQAAKA